MTVFGWPFAKTFVLASVEGTSKTVVNSASIKGLAKFYRARVVDDFSQTDRYNFWCWAIICALTFLDVCFSPIWWKRPFRITTKLLFFLTAFFAILVQMSMLGFSVFLIPIAFGLTCVLNQFIFAISLPFLRGQTRKRRGGARRTKGNGDTVL